MNTQQPFENNYRQNRPYGAGPSKQQNAIET